MALIITTEVDTESNGWRYRLREATKWWNDYLENHADDHEGDHIVITIGNGPIHSSLGRSVWSHHTGGSGFGLTEHMYRAEDGTYVSSEAL